MRPIILLLCLLFLNPLASQTFTFNTPQSIPAAATKLYDLDVTGVPSPLNESFGVEQICLNITYSQTDDLTIWLIAPDGTEITLTEENGGPNPNFTNTCFDGNSNSIPISNGSAPFTGSYLPEQSLSLFNSGSIDPNGTWQLKIRTNFFRTGTLESFALTISDNPVVPPTSTNDDCSTAIQLVVNNNYNCSLTSNAILANASASTTNDHCNFSGAPFDDDIWFRFTALANIQKFTFSNFTGTTNTLIYEILDGDCSNLTNLYCGDGTSNSFEVAGFTIGNNYFLRIASKTTASNQNLTFDICINEGVPPPPPNDDCASAQTLTYTDLSGTVAGANPSSEAINCGGEDGGFTNDVWYKFTATSSTQQVTVTDFQNGTTDDFDFQLNSGSCGSLMQIGNCFFNPQPITSILVVFQNLSIGTEYHLRMASFDSAPQNTTFKIKLNDPATTPSNNSCISATPLTLSSTGCNFANGTIAGATPSGYADFCDEEFSQEFDDDVWFKFSPSTSDLKINILNIEGSTQNFIYEVYRGPCNNLTSVLCQNTFNEEIELLGLNTTKEYFIRVASTNDLQENSTFDIRIESNPLEVCSVEPRGPGSLREAINNASANDIINFSPSVDQKEILLEAPVITLTQPLTFANSSGDEIIFRNKRISNTSVLLSIQNQISIEGLKLESNPEGALKIEVKNAGELTTFRE